MENPIKQINLNQLQYNPNRDPQVYRRTINKPFNLKVLLSGSGSANVSLIIEGNTVATQSIQMPGTFDYSQSFETAGSRVAMISVDVGDNHWQSHVRLDVLAKDWIG